MSINNIVNEFQNYSFNNTTTISDYLNGLKMADTLDEDNLNIQEYLLPEVMILLNKAVLNKLSADLLFKENYWSWGIITLYYSNFFLSQALNRLKGDFFTYIPNYGRRQGRKNIKLDEDGTYKLYGITNAYSDSHGGEFLKLKDNYSFLLLDSVDNKEYLNSILDIKESKIRNDINYKLSYFREFSFKEFRENFTIEQCLSEFENDSMSSSDEFKLLNINIDRFNLLFNLLKKVNDNNHIFEIEYNRFQDLLSKEITYSFKNEILRNIQNFIHKETRTHTVSTIVEKQFKKAMQ